MDFAFPPNVSPAMIVQARLKGHASVSSAGLSPVQFGSRNATSKKSQLPGGIGWLREVRLLQDPNPRLHNFPEVRKLLLLVGVKISYTPKQTPKRTSQQKGSACTREGSHRCNSASASEGTQTHAPYVQHVLFHG
jgi:hypothetical protein